MDPVKVGAAIRQLRLRAGYTQHDLADCLHVTDKAVSKWERGLSLPDVSIVTKLSILLNCDVDNLLEGNLSYLETAWQGLLILRECPDVSAGSEVFGKPLVYLFLSYFMLAGIGSIYISCGARDRQCITALLGDGSAYGIHLAFLPDTPLPRNANTMAVFGHPFVYGPNLTKYFQRAMSRQNGISVLTADKSVTKGDAAVIFDRHKAVQPAARQPQNGHCCVPIVFVPAQFSDQLGAVESVTALSPLFAEPMGNGMIAYPVTDREALLDTSVFLRFLSSRMGKEIYDLKSIAKRRNFIE